MQNLFKCSNGVVHPHNQNCDMLSLNGKITELLIFYSRNTYIQHLVPSCSMAFTCDESNFPVMAGDACPTISGFLAHSWRWRWFLNLGPKCPWMLLVDQSDHSIQSHKNLIHAKDQMTSSSAPMLMILHPFTASRANIKKGLRSKATLQVLQFHSSTPNDQHLSSCKHRCGWWYDPFLWPHPYHPQHQSTSWGQIHQTRLLM